MCEETSMDVASGNKYFEDPNVSGVVVKNCNISGFRFGVYLNRRVWVKSKATGKCLSLTEVSSLSSLKGSAADFDAYLGARSRHYGFNPSSVTLRNIHITDSLEVGVFVNEYARDWLLEGSSIQRNTVGVYLERESQGAKIYTSTIKENKILGIAVDSSAYNTIDRNIIDHNGYAGISLYKNCGEANGVPRYQHSDHNVIQRNVIKNHSNGFGLQTLTTEYYGGLSSKRYGVGVWIASRQGMSSAPILAAYPNATRACVDDSTATSRGDYYPDYAADNIVRWNNMSDNMLANVIVEDDRNVVEENNFSTTGNVSIQADVIIGSEFRQIVANVVRGNKVLRNVSTSQTLMGNFVTTFGVSEQNNQFAGNIGSQ